MRFENFIDTITDLIFIPDYIFFQAMGRTQSTRNLVHRWCGEGKLIRLKRGLYIPCERCRKKTAYLNFRAANTLVSPSYISLDSALSYHGLIPEKIVETTSVSIKRPRTISNPLGFFSYRKLNAAAYPHGVISEGGMDSFLIANREKALLDKIYFFHSGRNFNISYLFDSLRIEEDDLRTLNFDLIVEYSKFYGTKKMILAAKSIRRHYGI